MAFTRQENHCFYTADGLSGVRHGFATRLGGVSAAPYNTLNLGSSAHDNKQDILENYRRFMGGLGLEPDSLVFTKQVHRDEVRLVTAAHRGNGYAYPSIWECDALVTDTPGLALTVFWADCVPVLLYDPVRGAIGAAHAGWRGTALDIAAKTLHAMTDHFGSRPEDVRAAIGPSIAACCFETTDDVPQAMYEAFGTDAMRPYIVRKDELHFQVDLPGINAHLLTRQGVDYIERSGLCTCCRPDEFFSHRRSGTARGTHAAVICL